MVVPSDFSGFIFSDGPTDISVHLQQLISFNVGMLISLNQFPLVRFYNQVPILPDPFFGVIFDANILILLRVHEDLLTAFFIFKTDLVKTLTTFAAVGLYGGH